MLSIDTDVVDDIYNQQLNAGIDLIPVNDFNFLRQSFGSVLFSWRHPIEEVFCETIFLDEYFRLARGDGENIAAMEMTKWFDTNYHYLVPEIGQQQILLFPINSLLNKFCQNWILLQKQKFCLIGPETFSCSCSNRLVDKYSSKKN